MAALADTSALETWLGVSFSGSEETRAAAVLDAVSSLVRSEAGRTWEGETVPDDIATVVVQVAARVFNNPDGYTSERIDDYSYQVAANQVGLYLTPGEARIVGRYRAQPRGLWSLATTRDDSAADTAYVPVIGGPPFPWYASDVEVP